MKPKEVKPEETKPRRYDDCYIDKFAEIRNLSERIDFNDVTYIYKGEITPISFIGFKGPLHIFKSIYKGDKSLGDLKKD